MILLISYVPEAHIGDPLVTEVVLSESYEEVLETACEYWGHCLPPRTQILTCSLARQIQRAHGNRWITLHPQRFTDLVRSRDFNELELRLQIECKPVSSSPVDSFECETMTACASPDCWPNSGLICDPHGLTVDSPASLFVESVHMLTVQLTPRSPFEVLQFDSRPISPVDQPALPPYPYPTSTPFAFESGVTAFLAGRHAESQSQFQQAASEFHESGDIRGEADCMLHLGMSFRHSKDFVTARSSLLAARAIYESLGSGFRSEQLQCSRHLARVEEDRGNNQLALITYDELLRTTRREGLVTQHAWCSYYIGHLYNRMKLYREALNILKDVVNASRNICDGEMEGFATEELGYTAELQGHPQLAMNCYRKALQLFSIHGEGRWLENEKRVKKRIDRLKHRYPELLKTSLT